MKFKNKPIEVEAVQFSMDNWDIVCKFIECSPQPCSAQAEKRNWLWVPTPHGLVLATAGDWIVKNSKGELWVCPKGVFDECYEPACLPACADR